MSPLLLQTSRLALRQWEERDLEPFAALNGDPRVMEYFPFTYSRSESDEMAARLSKCIAENGWGLWAVETKGNEEFIGFVGLSRPTFDASFMPCVEVGWRLKFEAWGKGYATEAARECLRFGFQEIGLKEILSFTATTNLRSRRVMERIGMKHFPQEDFNHPKVPRGHVLEPHVLYRIAGTTPLFDL